MHSKPRFLSYAALALFAISFLPTARAGTIHINGIAPFDTSLGTLINVLVSLDPAGVQTSQHTAGSDSIASHFHMVTAPTVVIPDLDSFTFPTIPSTPTSSIAFANHSHHINLLPSIKSYTGVGLDWFLDPGNPTITGIIIPPFLTAQSEGHDHTVTLPTIIPKTSYTFLEYVPEPGTLALLSLGGLALIGFRRRGA